MTELQTNPSVPNGDAQGEVLRDTEANPEEVTPIGTGEVCCPKCGSKFATQTGAKSICPKCLFGFAMEPTDMNNPGGDDEPIFPEGTLIGPYKIINLLGRGGMGTVYKAYQSSLDRFVALKVLPTKLSGDEGFLKRFNREAKTLASLVHPNIVTIHDMGEYDTGLLDRRELSLDPVGGLGTRTPAGQPTIVLKDNIMISLLGIVGSIPLPANGIPINREKRNCQTIVRLLDFSRYSRL